MSAPTTTPAAEGTPPAGRGFLGYLASHPTAFWFFFWGEFAERCSFYGMRAMLPNYLKKEMGLGEGFGGTVYYMFVAACYLMPLVGGFLADRFFGKYWTIVGFSVPYVIAQALIGVPALPVVFIAMILLATGTGVIKPNISTLLGLTYDQQRPGDEKLRSDAFAMFYLSINVGAALSQLVVPAVRKSVADSAGGWAPYAYPIAFAIPAVFMALALGVFAFGKPFYGKETVGAKPATPAEAAERWVVLGRIGGLFILVTFFWAIFDQASATWIYFADGYMDVTLFALPASVAGWFGAKPEGDWYWVRSNAEQIQAFNPVFIVILLPFITWGWRKLDAAGIRIRPTDKMVTGFLLTALTMGVMALAAYLAGPGSTVVIRDKEGKPELNSDATQKFQKAIVEKGDQVVVFGADGKPQRKPGAGEKVTPSEFPEGVYVTETAEAPAGKRVTVWWQVLAFLIITVAEILISVTGLELAYSAAPKSMTGFVTGCWLLTVFLANALINAPVSQVYSWASVSPAMYFAGLTVVMLIVTGAFVPVAARFNRPQGPTPPGTEAAATGADPA